MEKDIQKQCTRIISELGLSLYEAGQILGCSWQSVQKKKSLISGNRFTEKNHEALMAYLENYKRKLENLVK